MKPGGIAGVIVSNRFLTTKAGVTLRKNILELFDIIHIWDFGDTQLFEAAVLPAVLLFKKKGSASSNIKQHLLAFYSSKDAKEAKNMGNIFGDRFWIVILM